MVMYTGELRFEKLALIENVIEKASSVWIDLIYVWLRRLYAQLVPSIKLILLFFSFWNLPRKL